MHLLQQAGCTKFQCKGIYSSGNIFLAIKSFLKKAIKVNKIFTLSFLLLNFLRHTNEQSENNGLRPNTKNVLKIKIHIYNEYRFKISDVKHPKTFFAYFLK